MRVKGGLAEMLKGGVIMDVTDAEQARIAEDAGACRGDGARARARRHPRATAASRAWPTRTRSSEIQESVTIPVMAKCRIGHFVEAQILEALEVDYIDESEVLTPADLEHHVDKWKFTVPFVCGCTNLGEALRRIGEGAAMIRTKGEAGTGDIVNAVTHMRAVFGGDPPAGSLPRTSSTPRRRSCSAPYDLVKWVAEHGRLPVVTFTAGGIATPADAALCMQLGADGVFVGSGIFKSADPSSAREGDRRGDDALPGRGDPRRASRAASASRWSGIPTQTLDPERAARDARLVGELAVAGRRRIEREAGLCPA